MNPLFAPPNSTIHNGTLNCGKNRVFILQTNNTPFVCVEIDGKVEKDTPNKKCDFLVIKELAEDIEIFIELKGKKIQDAYEQITQSYARYANKSKGIKHYVVIVTSSISPNEHTKLQNIKLKLKKQNLESFIKNNIIKARYNTSNNSIEKIN